MFLFVAAEPREFRGVLRFCGRMASVCLAVSWSREAELNGSRILMIANGAGADRAARAVDAVAKDATAVVSTGFCGALDPAFRIGNIFVASSVQGMPTS